MKIGLFHPAWRTSKTTIMSALMRKGAWNSAQGA